MTRGTERILTYRHHEPTHSSPLGVQSTRLGNEQIQIEQEYLSRYGN
jgi:hypothetical protein